MVDPRKALAMLKAIFGRTTDPPPGLWQKVERNRIRREKQAAAVAAARTRNRRTQQEDAEC